MTRNRGLAGQGGALGVVVVAILACILVGCGGSGAGSSGAASSHGGTSTATGSVRLTVTKEAAPGTRTVPSSTTAIRVSVVGTTITSTTSFPPGVSSVDISVPGVPVGQQTILVEALAGTQLVASAQSVVTVLPDVSNSVAMTLIPEKLAVAAINPPAGPVAGGTVTITGMNFATYGPVKVTFGGTVSSSVSVSSPTVLTCVSPAGAAGAVDVVVSNPDGSSVTLAKAYSYYVDTPVITTVAGTGVAGFSGEGVPAAGSHINWPWDVQVDASGSLVFVDGKNYRLRRIEAATGLIWTVAGTGVQGYSGNGGPATAANINPASIAYGPSGDLYLMDSGLPAPAPASRYLRKISASTGIISLVKNLTPTSVKLLGFTMSSSGDAYMSQWYGPAAVFKLDPVGNVALLNNKFSALRSVALNPAETQLYGSNQNGFDIGTEGHKVKRLDLASNLLFDFAGTGTPGFLGDGGSAALARLNEPWSVDTNAAGDVYILDRGNHRIRMVSAATGIINTVAGDGTSVAPAQAPNPRGDGGSPLNAQIGPLAVLCEWHGDLYFSEVDSHKVRRVTVAPNPVSLSPASGPVGATVTINGTNFRPGASVTFGGVASPLVQVSSLTQLTCTVPAGVTGSMPVPVHVWNQGTNKSVLAKAFTVVP